jgi:hypothetical protein
MTRWPCTSQHRNSDFDSEAWFAACEDADLSPSAWAVVSSMTSLIDRRGVAMASDVLDATEEDGLGNPLTLIDGAKELAAKSLLLDLGEGLVAVLPTIPVYPQEAL